MKLRLPLIALTALLLFNCSSGRVSMYHKGDLHSRTFLDFIPADEKPRTEYYVVKRDNQGQITSARHYADRHQLLERSTYSYSRSGQLKRHRSTEYFFKGPPRVSREWLYSNGKLVEREEKWFTRNRGLERRLTSHFDSEQKPYLEETWGVGKQIESSTEYYYDYKHRLDKSRRNFFNPDGELRDYWLTIYNDELQITHEEHYFANNALIAFYRYSYHPVQAYRQQEEVLEEDRDLFISRTFDEYGLILTEEERSRDMTLLNRKSFEYSENHKPVAIHLYDGKGKLIKSTKYRQAIYLQSFRTPGL